MKLFTKKSLLWVSMAIAFIFPQLSAQAQPAGARGNNFIYIMQAGDTIGNVAERFTSNPGNWRKIKSVNKISQDNHVPVGKEILVPFSLIDTYPDTGTITSIIGEVTINNASADKTVSITETSRIKTGQNSTITFKLSNDNVISVAPNSSIYVQRLRQFSGTGLIDAIFKTEQGEFSAKVDSNNGGVGRFEIRTPVSITGVRGTSLRNHVNANGDTVIELLSGKAAVSNTKNKTKETALPANQGANISSSGKIILNALPDAPQFTAKLDGNLLTIDLPNNPDTQTYVIRYTADKHGLVELARHPMKEHQMTLPLPNLSMFYLQVRAVNHKGLSGADTTQQIIVPTASESDSSAGGSAMVTPTSKT